MRDIFKIFTGVFSPSSAFTVSTGMTGKTVFETVESACSGSLLDERDFYGYRRTSAHSFSMRPQTRGINHFKPVIFGYVQEENGTAQVSVRMRMEMSVLIPMRLLTGFLLFYTVYCLVNMIFTADTSGLSEAVTSLGLFAFLEAVMRLSFRAPARRAKKKLEELLKRAS